MIARLLDAINVAPVAPAMVGRVSAVRGTFVTARGFRQPPGTGAFIGRSTRAEVIGFDGDDTRLMIVSGDHVDPGAEVRPSTTTPSTPVGDALLGRVLGAMGEPIDGRGPLLRLARRELKTPHGNPLARRPVDTPLATGVRAIDALLTLGRGQRIVVAAGAGAGKSTLMRQILDGTDADVVVLCLVGERSREIGDMTARIARLGTAARTVTVAVPADRPALLRIRAAERALTLAEDFAANGRHVLLFLDSLTRVAHAQRDLAIGMGETSGMRGYPPSASALIASLLERCGNGVGGAGSITAICTVLAEANDLDDPIVDAARAIADGHIVLSRSLAEQGVFPAIDLGRSLSRTMIDVVTPDHAAAAARARRLWSIAEEYRDLVLMGGYREGADPDIDEALAARPAILDFIAQPVDVHHGFDDSVNALVAGFTE